MSRHLLANVKTFSYLCGTKINRTKTQENMKHEVNLQELSTEQEFAICYEMLNRCRSTIANGRHMSEEADQLANMIYYRAHLYRLEYELQNNL